MPASASTVRVGRNVRLTTSTLTPAGAVKIARLLDGSLDHRLSCSLRGHYPTGSKGQRRVADRARGAISAGLPASPPGLSSRPRGCYRVSPACDRVPPVAAASRNVCAVASLSRAAACAQRRRSRASSSARGSGARWGSFHRSDSSDRARGRPERPGRLPRRAGDARRHDPHDLLGAERVPVHRIAKPRRARLRADDPAVLRRCRPRLRSAGNVFSVLGAVSADRAAPGTYSVSYSAAGDSIDDTEPYPPQSQAVSVARGDRDMRHRSPAPDKRSTG